jgi:hypothetical protein
VIYSLTVTKQRRDKPVEKPHFSLVHAFYGIMGGFAFYESYDDSETLFQISTNPRYPVQRPTVDTLVYIMKHFPNVITDITEDYILDQAESSSLSKALLIVQVAWFCTNCLSRLIQRLPLTLLEISTAAHAFCTLLTYFVWRHKPINVVAPTIMREKEAREVYALLDCSDEEYDRALEMAHQKAKENFLTPPGTHGKIVLAADALQRVLTNPERPPQPRSGRFTNSGRSLVPNIHGIDSSKGDQDVFLFIILALYPIVYGLVHFLAWGDKFPSSLEKVLWQASSLVITCSGVAGVSAFIYLKLWSDEGAVGFIAHILRGFVAGIVPLAHIFASGFLIVESFRQLAFLEPAAYQLPLWSNYWPHLS